LAASEVTERTGARVGAGRALRRSLIAAAVAATALAPVASRAQAPPPPPQTPNAGVLTPSSGMLAAAISDPSAALLQPSPLGNSAKPPRFAAWATWRRTRCPPPASSPRRRVSARRRFTAVPRVSALAIPLRFHQHVEEQKEGAEGQSAACAWAWRERAADHLR